ncbi:MarR family winged helix-turn-helix transcriptional regulator [Novosphingobium sp.]|jgi:DNA-binding MarR family transcriptional regulator|uniref:MarR family winged helix-turn-helix transcriptional regulator n=1 Tax=Novosphingobium sp. TaxID=1874826 RepID=UPI002FE11304
MGGKKQILRRDTDLSLGEWSIGPLSDLISIRLRRVDILLTRAFHDAEPNMRSGVVSTLALIASNPGISQKEIAQISGTDKSNVVPLVNALEEKGWAERRRSEDDGRRYCLYATAAGEAEINRIADCIHASERLMLAGVSEKDIEDLEAILNRMHDACLDVLQKRS